MRWLTIPLIALAAGCASFTQYAKWPARGPMLEVRNPTAVSRIVIARDGVGRTLVKATMKPNGRACFRWPFVDSRGELLAAGSDTLSTGPFEPWAADGWAWAMDGEPVADPGACR